MVRTATVIALVTGIVLALAGVSFTAAADTGRPRASTGAATAGPEAMDLVRAKGDGAASRLSG
jgi:hypothetical protein